MQPASNSKTAPCHVEPTEWVRFGTSLIHGLGGFARRSIPGGLRIIEYVGERIDKGESLRRCEEHNEFIFSLNEHEDLDGNVEWNPARFLNHSCAANCDAELIEGAIWITARFDISAGEELTLNYGFDLVDYKDYPCCCGSPGCVGYIVAEDFFEHVKKQRLL
jgi:SET domain-containing protein